MALSQEWIFKKDFLEDENSSRFNHTTDVKKEKENRFKTIWFMKDLSNILRPGPSKDSQKDRKEEEAEYDIRNLKVFWTACTFFHRFYVFHSFDSHARFAVAVACLFLASKVEEKPLRLSDHIFLYFRLRKNKVLKKTDQEFKDMERDVLLAERILLQTLSFDLNVVHPYQFFRQIIGKDLKSWFAEADDSKQVLRLATTLLSDSFRSTLCLQYPEQQLSLALVFMALCIGGLQPVPPSSGSSSQGYVRSSSGAGSSGASAGAGTGTKWLDLFEKDIDEHVLQNICLTLVEMYETPNSFAAADIPYPSHSALRSAITTGIAAVADARRTNGGNSGGGVGSGMGYGNTTPPLGIDTGVEEHKGGSPDYHHEHEQLSNKRKQLSPVATNNNSGSSGSDGFAGPVGSTSKYRHATLPPAFSDTTTTNNTNNTNTTTNGLSLPTPSSPCYDAPTPRSTYRHKPSYHNNPSATANTNTNTTTDDARLAGSVASPSADESWVPPPPESPMDSAHSTFSQMVAAQNSRGQAKGDMNGQDGLDTPLGSVTDTPTYMPPPPDTPGSMASTPNFANLPQPGNHHLQHLQQHMQQHMQQHLQQHLQDGVLLSNKKARTDY